MADRRPLTDFQIASLSPISGVASSTLKVHRADAVASGAVGALVGAAGSPCGITFGICASYGVKSGVEEKPFHIRVARWATIVIGGRFSSDSSVATMLAVSEWVWSTF